MLLFLLMLNESEALVDDSLLKMLKVRSVNILMLMLLKLNFGQDFEHRVC